MKNIKLLFYAFSFLLIFSSCDSDDDNGGDSIGEINTENLIGNWKLTDYHGTTESATTAQGITLTTTSTQEGNTYNAFIAFTENPNEFTSTGTFINHIVTTTQGQTIEQDIEVPALGGGTWSFSDDGSEITVTNNSQTEESPASTVLELSSTTFRIKTNLSSTIEISGVTIVDTSEIFQTFEKQ